MKLRHTAAFALVWAFVTAAQALAKPALLPVPYSVNEREDPTTFKPAPRMSHCTSLFLFRVGLLRRTLKRYTNGYLHRDS